MRESALEVVNFAFRARVSNEHAVCRGVSRISGSSPRSMPCASGWIRTKAGQLQLSAAEVLSASGGRTAIGTAGRWSDLPNTDNIRDHCDDSDPGADELPRKIFGRKIIPFGRANSRTGRPSRLTMSPSRAAAESYLTRLRIQTARSCRYGRAVRLPAANALAWRESVSKAGMTSWSVVFPRTIGWIRALWTAHPLSVASIKEV